MSARELIIEHLDLWTGAVTKKSSSGRGSNGKVELTGVEKLRELILELALRGKLTEQDAGDESAEQLIERIATLKANTRNGKRGTPQPPKNETPISRPFQVPSTWAWVPLRETGLTSTGKTPSTKNASFFSGDIPFIGPGQVTVRGKITKPEKSLSEEGAAHTEEALPGDILTVCIGGSIGKTAKVSERCGFNQQLNKIRPILVESDYLFFAISAKFFQKAIRENSTGSATPIINRSKWESICIPLAPFAEQKRIIEKVDELMALCDRLEQQTSDQLEAHETLVDTLLGTLTQSENATELADNWARLAAHFDTLFTTEQSIDKLKQTILQLAVMGRLVEQDFSSEDSSELLQKIESKREQLVQQGKLKGGDKRDVSEKTDTPFNLPANWSWVRISDLLPDFQNGASSRGDQSGSEVIVLRLADITNLEITLEDPRRLLISNSSISKYAVRKGDILIIRVNGSADLVGRFIPVEAPFDGIFCDHFIRLRIDSQIIEPRFLALVGSTELIRSRIEDLFVSTAGQKTVNQKHIGSLLTSLPPIEEQHRIVKKVDELTALCDQLKERLNQASETRCQLAETIVEQGLSA